MPELKVNSDYFVKDYKINNQQTLKAICSTKLLASRGSSAPSVGQSSPNTPQSVSNSNSNNSNQCKVTEDYSGLRIRKFLGDGKEYAAGIGTITLKTNKSSNYDLKFTLGAFGSVDRDGIDSNSDYVRIHTSKGDIYLSTNVDEDKVIIPSNNTGYDVKIENLKMYSENLEDQGNVWKTSKTFDVVLKNINEKEITIELKVNNEADAEDFGYQVGSVKCE